MELKASRVFLILFLSLIISSFLLACLAKTTAYTTEVPSQILPATQTPLPYPTQTLNPTPNLINYQATADTVTNGRVCEGAIIMGESPNKEWVIINCDPNPSKEKSITKVLRLDKTVSWEVSFYEIYGVHSGIEDGYIGSVHWSKDGNYVYLKPSFCCADAPGNIFFNYFGNSIGVYRLDLNTGELTTTLQPTSNIFASYAASFSSRDKYLTYVHSSNSTDIHIQNIQTGELEKFSLNEEYSASGLFTWSPDDKKLVFVAAKQGWQPYDDTQPQDSVSFFMLDIETGALQHLFDKQDIYKPIWITNDKLTLNQLDGDDFLLYDFQSSSFSAITPTPYK